MLAPMRWKRAAGASPGRSRMTLRYFRAAAHPPVLERLAVVTPDGVLDEAVALDPAALLPRARTRTGSPENSPWTDDSVRRARFQSALAYAHEMFGNYIRDSS